MIRPIACVLGGMLFAGTAVADELPVPPISPMDHAMGIAIRSADFVIATAATDARLSSSNPIAVSASLTGMARGLDEGLRQALTVYGHCTADWDHPPHNEPTYCNVAYGVGALQYATTMLGTMAFGRCSGGHLTSENHDLLIGDYTAAPRGKDGFVNLENKLCFWRDTGTVVDCPPPEPGCQ